MSPPRDYRASTVAWALIASALLIGGLTMVPTAEENQRRAAEQSKRMPGNGGLVATTHVDQPQARIDLRAAHLNAYKLVCVSAVAEDGKTVTALHCLSDRELTGASWMDVPAFTPAPLAKPGKDGDL
jgi:hypothetical protein